MESPNRPKLGLSKVKPVLRRVIEGHLGSMCWFAKEGPSEKVNCKLIPERQERSCEMEAVRVRVLSWRKCPQNRESSEFSWGEVQFIIRGKQTQRKSSQDHGKLEQRKIWAGVTYSFSSHPPQDPKWETCWRRKVTEWKGETFSTCWFQS